jgi:hypothetical protein
MTDMGRHTNGTGLRGDDGAMVTLPPAAISTALSPQRLVPFSLPWTAPRQEEPVVIADVPGRDSAWHRVAVAALPVAVVAVVAGIVSYSHIVALSLRAGQSIMDAHLSPIPVDGLIVGGSVILWFGSWLGWFAVAPGVAATLFANVESGLPRGPLAAAVAAWPAVAFTVATIVLERWLKSQAKTPALSPAGDVASDTEGDSSSDTKDEEMSPEPAPEPQQRRDIKPVPPRRQASRKARTGSDKARDIIKRNPGMAKAGVAKRAGITVRQVERVISDMELATS